MVKLNYAFKNGNLSLRISEKKERYYKSVKSLLLDAQGALAGGV